MEREITGHNPALEHESKYPKYLDVSGTPQNSHHIRQQVFTELMSLEHPLCPWSHARCQKSMTTPSMWLTLIKHLLYVSGPFLHPYDLLMKLIPLHFMDVKSEVKAGEVTIQVTKLIFARTGA